MESFGELIQRARKRSGWTQRDLSERLGVGQQAVSGWERGMSRPAEATVRQAADLLDLELASLMNALRDSGATASGADAVRPPVRPRVIRLPLQELQPDVFEQFSAELAAVLYPHARVHRFGGQGHVQGGIDVIVYHSEGLPTGIQCKREQKFGPAKVKKAVDELTVDVCHCFIFLTRVATPEARQEIAGHPSWTLWDVEDLSREVRSLRDRDAAVRLVDTYFPGWREPFLGMPSPGPWLTAEEFFRPFVKKGIYSHEWELVGRVAELAALRAYVTGADVGDQLAVVTGRGGIGKSRLLRAVARDLEVEDHILVRFLATDVVVGPADFEVLPPDDGLLVVVDDAHDRADTAAIIAGIRRFRPKAKVLLSLRPYGQAQLFTDLRQVGVHPSEVPTWELGDLTAQDAEALAQAVLGLNVEPRVATWLAVMAPDCPLLIVVGATLIQRGALDPARLEASEDIRTEILQLYGAVVADAPGISEPELRREVLKAVAVLQPFRLDQPAFQAAASTLTGRPFDQVTPHLRSLQDAGVLLRRGQSVRIVPDLLGDVILAGAAVDGPSGATTGYLERVCSATSEETLAHAVINAGRVDWQTRSRNGDVDSAAEVLWTSLIAEYETCVTRSRRRILQAVRHVAVFQPTHAIDMVGLALGGPPGTSSANVTLDDDVIKELPGILYRAALSLDHLPRAADLMWQLAREDTRPPHQYPEHPIRLLVELTEYAVGKPADFQRGMISAVQGWLRADDVAEHAHSPFAVLEPVLATEVEQRRFDGLTLTMRAYPINVDAVRPHRDRVVDLAFTEARAADVRRAVRAVQALENALRYPTGMFGRAVTVEEQDRWTPLFTNILGRLTQLAASPGPDPIVSIAVRQAVLWHAQYGTGDTGPAAQAVLASLPRDTEHQLAHALHGGWEPSISELDDYDEWSRRQEARLIELASDMCSRWSSDEVVHHLARHLTLHSYAYGHGAASPSSFVWTLVRHHPQVGASLVRRVVSDRSDSTAAEPDCLIALRELLPVTLSMLTEALPSEVMSLARALVDTPSFIDARAVAHALGSGRGTRTTLLDGEAGLLRNLIMHTDPHVRRLAVSAARLLGDGNRELAMQLVTGVRFDGFTELAAGVAALLMPPSAVSWRQLTEAQTVDLLDQLLACESIDNYHIIHLLSELSVDHPERILELLLRRVEADAKNPPTKEYRPLPFRWHTPLRFRDNKDFERLLRRVLDWIAEAPKSWIHDRMGAQVFAAVAGRYDEPVLRLLSEAITAGSRSRTLAVGNVLSAAPRAFAWTHPKFVTEALRAAEKLGNDCVRAIGGGLYSAALQGFCTGTPGQPFEEDLEQRDKAIELAKDLPRGSIEHQFYQSLAEAAEFNIKRDVERDALLDDRRTW